MIHLNAARDINSHRLLKADSVKRSDFGQKKPESRIGVLRHHTGIPVVSGPQARRDSKSSGIHISMSLWSVCNAREVARK